jgi:uncharacterized protein
MTLRVRLVALSAAVLVAACSPLAPQPNYAKFFVLTPISDSTAPAVSTASPSQLAIGIGPIDFPYYLKRVELVTRTSPNRVDLSPVDHWAELLDKNFERVLAENLAQLLNTQNIEKYPWSRRADVDYQIAISVERFKSTSDSQAPLAARWIIKDGATGKELYASRTSTATSQNPGDSGGAIALSEDLATLSRDIATEISQLSESRGLRTS